MFLRKRKENQENTQLEENKEVRENESSQYKN